MEGTSLTGKTKGPLGPSSASKLAFFLCPEMPFFIYDSVVGKAMRRSRPKSVSEYQTWCNELKKLLPNPESFCKLVRKDRRHEFTHRMDWLARRSLDLALYRIGENI